MPAGEPYFAWVDASETTFVSGHMRWDESVFSFSCEQSEGDPASLTVVVRRPRNVSGNPIGLLGPGRKIWAWFAIDCGSSLFKFRGRLVGVPTSIFEELVTLEFIARPFDVVAQKEALAATLRVLPYYDEIVLDEARRTDPEAVLEGYSKIWAYDREAHILTVSDEISGEDGLVEFDGASEDGKVLYDGLGLTLTSGPLARVDVFAEYNWTQQAYGGVDITSHVVGNWPNEPSSALAGFKIPPGSITSFTLRGDSWPKTGAGLGDGWEVTNSTAFEPYRYGTYTSSASSTVNIKWWDGDTMTISQSSSHTYADVPKGSINWGNLPASNDMQVTLDRHGSVVAWSRSASGAYAVLPMYLTQPTLTAGYTAARPFTDMVSLSLFADVQHVMTDPEDGEALRIDDIRSVNLSDPIGGVAPIVDPRRRSYVATERGNQSIEHLICLARAQLLKRSRVVEITVVPKLSRMPEITLRKNAFIIEPRIGEATGKIIGYKLALDGADGRINCEVRVGCAIGRGGSQIASGGNPTYCSASYVGADYQQYTDRIVLFDTSVGYEPPLANPNDDGLNFLSTVSVDDVIDTPLSVEWPPAEQRAYIMNFGNMDHHLPSGAGVSRSQAYTNMMQKTVTKATFKLKSMTREFQTPYDIQVTDLKVPTGYNLEAT